MRNRRINGIVIGSLVLLSTQASAAQDVTAATLAAAVTAPAPATAPAASSPPPAFKADLSPSGLRFGAPGGHEFRLRAIIQVDGNFYLNDEKTPKTNQLQMRRVRLIADGKLSGLGAIYIQPDFGQGRITILDSYIDVTPWTWLGVRAGKFKTPVGLERLLPDPALVFPETSLASVLTPGRDVGAQIQGNLGKGMLTYSAGVFNGVADGAVGDLDYADEKDFVARVFSEPFVASENRFLRGIGLGAGASVGNQRGTYFQKTQFAPVQNLAQLKSVGGTTFFAFDSGASYAGTVVADGPNRRVAPQGWYFAGPFGVVGEYVQTQHQVKRAAKAADIRFDAWSATASYLLTGEKASPYGTTPERPLGEGAGAWQIVGTVSSLIVDADAFPVYANPAKSARAARAWGVALNWYANASLRVSAAYERTRFEEASASVAALPHEDFMMGRLQLGFL